MIESSIGLSIFDESKDKLDEFITNLLLLY